MNPLSRQPVEREAVEREREPSRVADDEPEARARDLRAALHVVVRQLEVLRCVLRRLRLAPLLDDDRVLVAVTVGGRLVRQVRDLAERGVARRLGGGELAPRPPAALP